MSEENAARGIFLPEKGTAGMKYDISAALEKLLSAHQRYYTINRDTPAAPFSAEAEFQVHDERYFQ